MTRDIVAFEREELKRENVLLIGRFYCGHDSNFIFPYRVVIKKYFNSSLI